MAPKKSYGNAISGSRLKKVREAAHKAESAAEAIPRHKNPHVHEAAKAFRDEATHEANRVGDARKDLATLGAGAVGVGAEAYGIHRAHKAMQKQLATRRKVVGGLAAATGVGAAYAAHKATSSKKEAELALQALDKLGGFFGPSATDRMRAAYMDTPTQVHTPAPAAAPAAAAAPARPAPMPVSTAATAEARAAENLAHAAPQQAGVRGMVDKVTGGRMDALRAAEDNIAANASKMHPEELKAHMGALNSAFGVEQAAVSKARRVAGGVAAAGGLLAAGGAAANHAAQQAAATASRNKLMGGLAGGLALGAGLAGVHHMFSPKQQPQAQPAR